MAAAYSQYSSVETTSELARAWLWFRLPDPGLFWSSSIAISVDQKSISPMISCSRPCLLELFWVEAGAALFVDCASSRTYRPACDSVMAAICTGIERLAGESRIVLGGMSKVGLEPHDATTDHSWALSDSGCISPSRNRFMQLIQSYRFSRYVPNSI